MYAFMDVCRVHIEFIVNLVECFKILGNAEINIIWEQNKYHIYLVDEIFMYIANGSCLLLLCAPPVLFNNLTFLPSIYALTVIQKLHQNSTNITMSPCNVL